MRTRACVAGLVIALTEVISGGSATHAQTTSTPTTIWSFMGVPNPFGANAAAQQSSNPAIQAAAKAKAAKHEICKKKAAIQYLAGLGCTPEHPEVMPALLAAMGDPDEQVRYEAVKAVLQTAEVCQSPEQKKATRKAKGMSETCKDWKKACEKQVCDAVDRLCGKAPRPPRSTITSSRKRSRASSAANARIRRRRIAPAPTGGARAAAPRCATS